MRRFDFDCRLSARFTPETDFVCVFWQANGVYNPQKLMGVTTLDVVRAKTFVAENQGKVAFLFFPVNICGVRVAFWGQCVVSRPARSLARKDGGEVLPKWHR